MTGLIIGILVSLSILMIFIGMYNSLIGKRNQVENSFGTIDVMLKKRYDLIPNLVATVKQYMEHEKGTLENITKLRAQAMNGNISTEDKVELNNKLNKMIGGIMVAVENYPDLKANENFMQLQRSLNEIEEQISAARRTYNASVTDYNNSVDMFPTSMIAGMIGFRRRHVFEAAEHERENVQVKDLF